MNQAIIDQLQRMNGHACDACGYRIEQTSVLKLLKKHGMTTLKPGAAHLAHLCADCLLQRKNPSSPVAIRRRALTNQRREELFRYFQDTPVRLQNNDQLRCPQLRAYEELYRYFHEQPNGPAIIELPTGCGKTGVIAISPFRVSHGRVLILTPGLVIREGVERTLSAPHPERNFYLKTNVVQHATQLPKVVILHQGSRSNLEDCLRADLIVANIQQGRRYLTRLPENFFDLIIVDEAHHTPAESWQQIRKAFAGAKRIYVTGTPFRSDRQEIEGTVVYRYPLAEAIANRYVKNIVKVDAIPGEITFVVEGSTRRFTTDEILDMREEDWFSRGVAMSEASALSIIDKVKDLLEAKRRTGVPHQVIGAACSIAHAKQLVNLFTAKGLTATYIASVMKEDERRRRLRAFEQGEYDCIIHIGILGEGYDHPCLSIAALFRPYRSRGPYEQLIGRTLRIIPGVSETHNIAHIVAHAGLNLDGLWEAFKSEFRAQMQDVEFDPFEMLTQGTPQAGGARSPRALGGPRVEGETIAGFQTDAFMTEHTRNQPMPRLEQELGRVAESGGGLSDLMRELQHNVDTPDVDTGTLPAHPGNRPDLERQRENKRLNAAEKRCAAGLLRQLQLEQVPDLATRIGKGTETSPYEVIIRLVHRRVNLFMGKEESASERGQWSIEELRDALSRIDTVGPLLQEEITAKLTAPAGHPES